MNAAQTELPAPDQPSSATVIAASAEEVNAGGSGVILMQTAQVYAAGESGQKRVRAMLDTGSNQSFVTASVANQLQC